MRILNATVISVPSVFTGMPISIAEFNGTPVTELPTHRDPTHVETIETFLAEHADEAFTLREIRKATGVPRGCIGSVLAKLEDSGRVRHRGVYWASGADGDQERQ